MPHVRAKVVCFIDNHLRQEGDVFEYNGPPNSNVEPIGSAPAEAEPAAEPAQEPARKWKPKARRGSGDGMD